MVEDEIVIRPIKPREWDMALQLAWDTFLIYDAPLFKMEGVRNFQAFIKDPKLYDMFHSHDFRVLGAFKSDIIIGVLGARGQHISLLFVDGEYQNLGIATSLLCEYYKEMKALCFNSITVNSSPCAVDFYKKIGFKSLSAEIKKDGIIYTPMRYDIH